MMSDRTLGEAMNRHYRQPHEHPDEQLLREALEALKVFMSAADWDGGDIATLNITQLQMGLVQVRAAITKLEERLLIEKV